jgi:hypothetical protein
MFYAAHSFSTIVAGLWTAANWRVCAVTLGLCTLAQNVHKHTLVSFVTLEICPILAKYIWYSSFEQKCCTIAVHTHIRKQYLHICHQHVNTYFHMLCVYFIRSRHPLTRLFKQSAAHMYFAWNKLSTCSIRLDLLQYDWNKLNTQLGILVYHSRGPLPPTHHRAYGSTIGVAGSISDCDACRIVGWQSDDCRLDWRSALPIQSATNATSIWLLVLPAW